MLTPCVAVMLAMAVAAPRIPPPIAAANGAAAVAANPDATYDAAFTCRAIFPLFMLRVSAVVFS